MTFVHGERGAGTAPTWRTPGLAVVYFKPAVRYPSSRKWKCLFKA